jgi:phosphoribosylaminoimidazole carboxylase
MYLFFQFKFILVRDVCLNVVKPRVGIIMGSDSDLPIMKDAARILTVFGVPHEVAF